MEKAEAMSLMRIALFCLFLGIGRLSTGESALAKNSKVDIKVPSPFDIEFSLEMGFPLEQFKTKLGQKPWLPVCQGESCKIYLGDRKYLTHSAGREMFPVYVELKLLESELLKDLKKLDKFILSLDPGFFSLRGSTLARSTSDKTNALGTPLKAIDVGLEGGSQTFSSYIILMQVPLILISENGEVVMDSIRPTKPSQKSFVGNPKNE
jgi:hypothetical protein